MLIEHSDSKTIIAWLSQGEYTDLAVKARLQSLYAEYTGTKTKVVVMRSGHDDLAALTSDLLRYNRDLSARLAVAKQRRESATGNQPDTEESTR